MTPLVGRRIDKDGHGKMLIRAAFLGTVGALLSLIPNVWMVIAGLAICCSGVFIAQASATSFVGVAAKHNRALALGLYVSFYYAGGSLGGNGSGVVVANVRVAGVRGSGGRGADGDRGSGVGPVDYPRPLSRSRRRVGSVSAR